MDELPSLGTNRVSVKSCVKFHGEMISSKPQKIGLRKLFFLNLYFTNGSSFQSTANKTQSSPLENTVWGSYSLTATADGQQEASIL